MISNKEVPLDLEEVKLLLEKVYAAQQAGNHVVFNYSNFCVNVLTMIGEFEGRKEWFGEFDMYFSSPESQRKNYEKCIAQLEKLAGEKCDN